MALIYSLNYVKQYVLRLVSCVVAYWIFRHVFIGSNLGYVKMRFSPFMWPPLCYFTLCRGLLYQSFVFSEDL
jgi:hypothetical protein